MSDMIFKNRNDLSLLDQFKVHTRQKQIEEVLRRSYPIVQENLKAILDAVESDITALVDMPPSDRYKMSTNSARDKTSLKFRWFVTLSVMGTAHPPYDDIFKDTETHVKDRSFRIIISPKHIGYELDSSGNRKMFRFVSSTLQDHTLELNHVNTDARTKAIAEVQKALAEWIAESCPDHAAFYFMQNEKMMAFLEAQTLSNDKNRHNTALKDDKANRIAADFGETFQAIQCTGIAPQHGEKSPFHKYNLK